MAVRTERLYEAADVYGGIPHGDDPEGRFDIQFPDVFGAAQFARAYTRGSDVRPAMLAACDIRQGDSVDSLGSSVVLTMTPNPVYPSVEMFTMDGAMIYHGLRVWDYDLKRGTVDLEYRAPEQEGKDPQWWFYVRRDGGGLVLQSDTRVRVWHPSTYELA